ncbi:Ig-like domain repeat protein [Archangium violaceum]|uniref:adventurous gliding motility protein AgmC n=1 Tax=Archangium violaceum TaxID=83451 RepID=UPI00193BE7E2|nr:Ig-like domain-containing protein [Archangium violaceum]QRK13284.1 Ig-like domain repeat protein [Archangium violaceum]
MRRAYTQALLALVLLAASPSQAEPDTFGLGEGVLEADDLTVDANSSITVNSYARVTLPLAPGDTQISIDTVDPGAGRQASTAFRGGDLVMVLQTTGLVPVLQTKMTTPLDISTSEVGHWEFARLAAGTTVSILKLEKPLVRSYAAKVTQVVLVPEYRKVTLNANGGEKKFGTIKAKDWDGKTGGVVAFLASEDVTINGHIRADGLGFRGGKYLADNLLTPSTGCSGESGESPLHAQKGEGIDITHYANASDPTVTNWAGLGNFANGAGGGVCLRSGGGGGGNAGSGGKGGLSAESTPRDVGGMGGVSLVYSILERLTFGGGGGSGHGNQVTDPAHGGAGGGLIFIRAKSLTINSQASINASGAEGSKADSQGLGGGGGGGAGGTIVLRLTGALSCTSADLIMAAGGKGGTTSTPAGGTKPGTGGGGGGGRVLLQASSISEDCIRPTMVAGGTLAGTQPGQSGSISSLPGSFPASLQAPTLDAVASTGESGYTNLRRPIIQGGIADTSYAGFGVVIYLGNQEVGRTTADSTGHFSFKMPQNLVDGEYQVSAAFAHQGVQSPKSPPRSFVVDGTPPANPVVDLLAQRAADENMLIGRPDLDASDKLSISGRAEPGSTVTVVQTRPDFSATESGVVDALGKWKVSITQPPDVDTTEYTLSMTAKDKAYNSSPSSTTLTFRLDTRRPGVPVVQTVGDVTAGGSVPVNSLRPVLQGTADSGNRVVVTLTRTGAGSESPQTLETTSSSGTWKVVPSAPLTDAATYSIDVKAYDQANNERSGTPKTFSVDVTAPSVLTITSVGAKTREPREGMLIGGPDLASSNLSIGGKVDSGSTVTVKQLRPSSTPATTATVSSDNWNVSLAMPADTAPTAYTLEVTAEDAAKNKKTMTLNFTLDTQKPAAPTVSAVAGVAPYTSCAVSPTRFVTNKQPLIQGTGEVRGTVNMTLAPAYDVPPTVVNGTSGTGNWSASPTSDSLLDGYYTLTVKLTDEAGNESPTATYCFQLDATAPPKPDSIVFVTTTPSGTTTTPAVNGMLIGRALLTNVNDAVVSGELVPNGTLSISGNSSGTRVHLKLIPKNPAMPVSDSVLTDVSGTWNKSWTGLVSGSYAVEARAEDAASNLGDPETIFFDLDLVPPKVSFTKLPDGITASKDAVFGFKPSESVQKYRCTIKETSGPTTSLDDCSNPLFHTVARAGEYTIQVWAKDLAGNETFTTVSAPIPADMAAPTYTWKVDDNQPLAKILNWDTAVLGKEMLPVENGGGTSKDSVAFVIQADKDNMQIGCKREGQTDWTEPCCTDAELIKDVAPATPERPICIKSYSAPELAEGDHVFSVKAYSRDLGVETPESARVTYSWFVDKQSPLTLITTPQLDWVSADYLQVNLVTPNEPKGVERYDYELNGASSTTTNSYIVINFPKAGGDKPYTLKIKAIDKAGNVEEKAVERSWTVDRLAPAAPIVQLPQEGGRYKDLTLSGTTAIEDAYSTISFYLDPENDDVEGTLIGTTTADGEGKWNLVIASDKKPADGLHVIKAKATDRAGNTDTTSRSTAIRFILDNVPPVVNITGPDKNTSNRSAEFNITANEEGVTFQCKLDIEEEPQNCGTQVTFTDLLEGPHTLNVYAVDQAGNRRETSYSWSIYLGNDIRAEGGGLGCSSASAGPSMLWLLGILGLLLKASQHRGSKQ